MSAVTEDAPCKDHVEYELSQEAHVDVSSTWKNLRADRDMILAKMPKKKK